MSSVRTTGAVALICLCALFTAPAAGAATVSFVPGGSDIQKVLYTAGAGEANDLTVTYDQSTHRYSFKDSAGVVVSTPDTSNGCTVSVNTASCPDPQLPDPGDVCDPFDGTGDCPDDVELEVRLGNLGDTASISARGASTDVLLDGGEGDDALTAVSGRNIMRGGKGSDELTGGPNRDLLFGVGQGTQVDNGPGAGDTLHAGPGPDRATGGSGDDVLDGGPGNDALRGGGGIDTADYSAADGGVQADLGLGAVSGNAGDDTLATVESLRGSEFDDDLRGDAAVNTISGLGGADLIVSRDQVADSVSCGDGVDPTVVADALDGFPAADCEDVDDGVPPPPAPDPGTGASAKQPAAAPVTPKAVSVVVIAGAAVKVSTRGSARVALRCSGRRRCRGTVTLTTSKPVRSGRRKRVVRLGQARFAIPAHRGRKVLIHVSPVNLRLLRRLGSVTTEVVVRDRDSAGRRRVGSRLVVVRAPGR